MNPDFESGQISEISHQEFSSEFSPGREPGIEAIAGRFVQGGGRIQD